MSWRQWEGDYVVFNAASGNTHLLDIASGEVLMALLGGPASASQIAERLAKFLEVANDDGLQAAADGIVSNLDDLGLIERAEPC